MELTSKNLQDVYWDCHFNGRDQNMPLGITIKEFSGVGTITDLHMEKVELNREKIEALLSQLPTNFYEKKGGGWTFLNACIDNKGNQWTDHHSVVDMLVVLGLAIDKLYFLTPKELWTHFPGGVPYICIKD